MMKPSTIVPMRSMAVNFTYGMIVNDTDLTAAMHYPVQLMQAVNRAVYGCGVVCGFMFDPDPDICGQIVDCDPCDPDGNSNGKKAYRGFKVQVGRGTAINCEGLPIEICEPAIVDVSPDPCAKKCEDDKDTSWVCIVARRAEADEAPRSDCCSDDQEPSCARKRDHVELRAFAPDKLPEFTCQYWPDKPGSACGCGDGQNSTVGGAARNPEDVHMDMCKCLIQCDPCDCCGEGWVLLGCVEICETGVLVENFRQPGKYGLGPYPMAPYKHRQMIKPIECMCRERWNVQNVDVQAMTLADITEKVETAFKDVTLSDQKKLTGPQMKKVANLAHLAGHDRIDAMFKEQPDVVMNMLGLQSEKKCREVIEILSKVMKEG
ncbi:hypothetical protein RKLH11_3761 [Rhodobacteraceae bacterium KLH11]|nr:hypothetical protein RKLH11_3761 [Rhodobacteraceae bacterium KLH11]